MINPVLTFNKFGLDFRAIEKEDAAFILELRTDTVLSKFLSETSVDIRDQITWIEKYKERESKDEEYYFVNLSKTGEKLGVNRIYNIETDTFEIGSWLYKQGLNVSIPILGDLAIRDFAFDHYQKPYCKFEVRKNNASVLRYHKMFQPKLIKEDELNFYFLLSYDDYSKQRAKLLKSLI